jgi:hypothetical protein
MLKTITDPNKHIGTFPIKGTYVHHYFSKIYLDAYVFRGLPTASSSQTSVIPQPFVETALAAVAAAIDVVNIILGDIEVQVGLAGVPHYFYGMIAFACVFLVKAATKHRVQLVIDQQEIQMLIERLSNQLSATQVGRGHVIHRMAGGLRKMAESLRPREPLSRQHASGAKVGRPESDHAPNGAAVLTPVDTGLSSFDQFSALDDGINIGFSDSSLGFGMPFFDFEGTSLDMSSPMLSFPT